MYPPTVNLNNQNIGVSAIPSDSGIPIVLKPTVNPDTCKKILQSIIDKDGIDWKIKLKVTGIRDNLLKGNPLVWGVCDEVNILLFELGLGRHRYVKEDTPEQIVAKTINRIDSLLNLQLRWSFKKILRELRNQGKRISNPIDC